VSALQDIHLMAFLTKWRKVPAYKQTRQAFDDFFAPSKNFKQVSKVPTRIILDYVMVEDTDDEIEAHQLMLSCHSSHLRRYATGRCEWMYCYWMIQINGRQYSVNYSSSEVNDDKQWMWISMSRLDNISISFRYRPDCRPAEVHHWRTERTSRRQQSVRQ